MTGSPLEHQFLTQLVPSLASTTPATCAGSTTWSHGVAQPALLIEAVPAPDDMAKATGVRYMAADFHWLKSLCPQLAPSEPPSGACLEILRGRPAG